MRLRGLIVLGLLVTSFAVHDVAGAAAPEGGGQPILEGRPRPSVSAGSSHTCAVTETGQVRCWGLNSSGQTTVEPGQYVHVSSGGSHTCALTAQGAAKCWGASGLDQAQDKPGPFMQIAVGSSHNCALGVTGGAECWGSNGEGEAVNHTGPFIQISAGLAFTCALTLAGDASCWGFDGAGQATNHPGPYSQISAGGAHACALTLIGNVDCWGANDSGQAADQAGPFTQVSAGGAHTCAIRMISSDIFCWGNNGKNQAGGLHTGTFAAVSAGGTHNCAISVSGSLDCWGSNSSGQTTPPTGVALYTHRAIAAGLGHTCAIVPSGRVDCWGSNTSGQAADQSASSYSQIGTGNLHSCAIAVGGSVTCWGSSSFGQDVDQAGPFTQLAVGASHNCAITTAATISCWGLNTSGQTTAPAGTFTQIAAGAQHSCALSTAGAADCWGSNAQGQAADPAGPFTQIASGSFHNCALTTAGAAECWGSAGAGATTPDAGPFVQIVGGANHSCGLTTNGDAKCWGYNVSGQSEDMTGPFTQLSAGGDHTCAVRDDDGIVCWGSDDLDQSTPDVTAEPYDFGDTSSGTTIASNGARHRISKLWLGTAVDADDDGQPTVDATGDDTDGRDDDDGVYVVGDVVVGNGGLAFVTASYYGLLDVWIDQDKDGSFVDAGSHVVTDQQLYPGSNSVGFSVADDAAGGDTPMRFRVSSSGGLSPTGAANDGEVEDITVFVVRRDYGDAPPPYPTLPGDDGAFHNVGGPVLGTLVDTETTGQPSIGATGDDFDDSDDEDGVTFATPVYAGIDAGVDVKVSIDSHLDAWIDFNADGDWTDAGEQIFSLQSVDAGTNHLTFTVSNAAVVGTTYARFRVTTDGLGPYPSGYATDGEVEDYSITIGPAEFGDAPAPYPTTLASNGPRHVAGSLRLGSLVDTEPDGQPNADATGDDQTGTDDDDGIAFTSPVYAGASTKVSVAASAAGLLSAWVDVNRDGDWLDAHERVLTDKPLVAGTNAIGFTLPLNTKLGATFARFRFSSQSGLGPTGQAPNGEVEDYGVTVVRIPKGAIVCGQTVGGDVVLRADLVECPENGLIVGRRATAIDLRGHTISGLGDFGGVNDFAGYDRLTVRNGKITGFGTAVYFPNAAGSRIKSVDASGNQYGIAGGGNKVAVRGVTANDNTTGDGIVIFSGNAVVVSASTSNGNAEDGIDVDAASATISGNTANDNAAEGIVAADVPAITGSGNHAQGNGIADCTPTRLCA